MPRRIRRGSVSSPSGNKPGLLRRVRSRTSSSSKDKLPGIEGLPAGAASSRSADALPNVPAAPSTDDQLQTGDTSSSTSSSSGSKSGLLRRVRSRTSSSKDKLPGLPAAAMSVGAKGDTLTKAGAAFAVEQLRAERARQERLGELDKDIARLVAELKVLDARIQAKISKRGKKATAEDKAAVTSLEQEKAPKQAELARAKEEQSLLSNAPRIAGMSEDASEAYTELALAHDQRMQQRPVYASLNLAKLIRKFEQESDFVGTFAGYIGDVKTSLRTINDEAATTDARTSEQVELDATKATIAADFTGFGVEVVVDAKEGGHQPIVIISLASAGTEKNDANTVVFKQTPLSTTVLNELCSAQHAYYRLQADPVARRSLPDVFGTYRIKQPESQGSGEMDLLQVMQYLPINLEIFFRELHESVDANPNEILVKALEVILQIIDAMIAYCERGVYWSDLKPSNIAIYRDEKGQLQIKIIDFKELLCASADVDVDIANARERQCLKTPGEVFFSNRYMDDRALVVVETNNESASAAASQSKQQLQMGRLNLLNILASLTQLLTNEKFSSDMSIAKQPNYEHPVFQTNLAAAKTTDIVAKLKQCYSILGEGDLGTTKLAGTLPDLDYLQTVHDSLAVVLVAVPEADRAAYGFNTPQHVFEGIYMHEQGRQGQTTHAALCIALSQFTDSVDNITEVVQRSAKQAHGFESDAHTQTNYTVTDLLQASFLLYLNELIQSERDVSASATHLREGASSPVCVSTMVDDLQELLGSNFSLDLNGQQSVGAQQARITCCFSKINSALSSKAAQLPKSMQELPQIITAMTSFSGSRQQQQAPGLMAAHG